MTHQSSESAGVGQFSEQAVNPLSHGPVVPAPLGSAVPGAGPQLQTPRKRLQLLLQRKHSVWQVAG